MIRLRPSPAAMRQRRGIARDVRLVRPLGHDLLRDLVDFWPLSEQEDSRFGAHAFLRLADNSTVTGADGVGSLASLFTAASNEYLSRGSEAALQTGDIDYTLAYWISLVSKATTQAIITKYDTGLSGQLEFYSDYAASTDRLRFIVSGDGTSGTQTAVSANNFGSPSTDTWTFVVMWHDSVGNSINIQVNNGTADTASHSAGSFAGASDFEIGRAGSTLLRPLDARMQRVGYWKRLLTADEKTFLYNGARGRDYAFD